MLRWSKLEGESSSPKVQCASPGRVETCVPFLMKLVAARAQMEAACEDVDEVNALIESLCSS